MERVMRASRFLILLAAVLFALPAQAGEGKIRVMTTSSSYKPIVEYIGGEYVEVSYIIQGYQDPHIVRPKPSLAVELAKTDLLVATGLDLEMWLPSLQDMSGNPNIRSGQPGYVSVTAGMDIAEKPTSLDRSEGDVHVFGNPHVHTSPLNGKNIAENIAVGLARVDPAHAEVYKANLKRFEREVDERVFGKELVRILGGRTLDRLAKQGKLVSFLQEKQYKGTPLIEKLGGWMKQALPLRGLKVISYHKNWTYFSQIFGIEVVGYMEPKPGIPPSPGHIVELITKMQSQGIKLVFAANYFDQAKVLRVTEKTGAEPVIVGLAVDGMEGMDTFFDQFDIWIGALLEGARKTGAIQ